MKSFHPDPVNFTDKPTNKEMPEPVLPAPRPSSQPHRETQRGAGRNLRPGVLDPSTACPLYSQALPCSPRPSHPVVKLSSSSCTIPLAQKHSRPPRAHLHLFPHDTHRCLSRTHIFLLAASNLTFLGLSALWAVLSLRNAPLGPPWRCCLH